MMWLLRRGKRGVIHRAVQEGGGHMVIMMSSCGLQIRWDLPHTPWERAKVTDYSAVTCKRCRG